MTTVACVWVHANVAYDVAYVERLAAMVRRWIDRPYRFVCLTDRPWLLPDGIESMPVPNPRPLFGWWSKIELFAPDRFTGRVLSLDLDTLIVNSLQPILDYPAPFALVPHGGHFQPRTGHHVVQRFNSSVMVWDAGVNAKVYSTFTPAVAKRLWGDQDHIGEQMPEAATMPQAWFPRLSEVPNGPSNEAKVVLAKVPKNHIAAQDRPWVAEAWR